MPPAGPLSLKPALGSRHPVSLFEPFRVVVTVRAPEAPRRVELWCSDPSAGSADANGGPGEWGAVLAAPCEASGTAYEAWLVPWRAGPVELTARLIDASGLEVWAGGERHNTVLEVEAAAGPERLPGAGSAEARELSLALLRAVEAPDRLGAYLGCLFFCALHRAGHGEVAEEACEALAASEWLVPPENAARLLRWLMAPSAAAAARCVAALKRRSAGGAALARVPSLGLCRLVVEVEADAPGGAVGHQSWLPSPPPSPTGSRARSPAPRFDAQVALHLYDLAAEDLDPVLVDVTEIALPGAGDAERRALLARAVERSCAASSVRAQLLHRRFVELLLANGSAPGLLQLLARRMLDCADLAAGGAELESAPQEFVGALQLLVLLVQWVRRSESLCAERVQLLREATAAVDALLCGTRSEDGSAEAALATAAVALARVHPSLGAHLVRSVLRHWWLAAPTAAVCARLGLLQQLLGALSETSLLLEGGVAARLLATVLRCVRSRSAAVATLAIALAASRPLMALAVATGGGERLAAALEAACGHWDAGVADAAARALRQPVLLPQALGGGGAAGAGGGGGGGDDDEARRCRNRFCRQSAARCARESGW